MPGYPVGDSVHLLLVGDCGGTNTRLKLYGLRWQDALLQNGQGAPGELIAEQQYLNCEYGSFDEVVNTFLKDSNAHVQPTAACFAVAGPVSDNAVTFTNRNWMIDGAAVEKALGIKKVRLINDFVANGYGLLTLDTAKECVTLQDVPAVAGAPIVCVGAGTGLGECFSTATAPGEPYETYPSEGGHAEFAPRNDVEVELLQFLKHKFEQKHRVSIERVVSGPGLASVYEFYSTRFASKCNAAVKKHVLEAGDFKGRVIATHSQKGASPRCEVCVMVMETFASAYGSEAGVAALKWIPLGGLYIAGGLAPKNMHLLRGADSLFMRAFHDKGRVSPLLKNVPLHVVLAEDIGQRGAHLVSFRLLQNIAAAPAAEDGGLPAERSLKRRGTQFGMNLGRSGASLLSDGSGTVAYCAGEVSAGLEVATVKHSVHQLRGSYSRVFVVGEDGISTLDPTSRRRTNVWPRSEILGVTPTGGVADRHTFELSLKSPPALALLCMSFQGQVLRFSVSSESELTQLCEGVRKLCEIGPERVA
mmetsp:Transcript_33723/g.71943  ORF Transcript_33723/g.71943 Transcript_33723/m.71943 type:complete len:531 (-) Transcript_33723:182-1774(-)